MLSLSKLYGYLFGNRAVIDVSNVPQNKREACRKKREENIRGEFGDVFIDTNFRNFLRTIHADALEAILYRNTTDSTNLLSLTNPSSYHLPSDEEIMKHFDEQNTIYALFDKNDQAARDLYLIFILNVII
jgi:hypothetical protein